MVVGDIELRELKKWESVKMLLNYVSYVLNLEYVIYVILVLNNLDFYHQSRFVTEKWRTNRFHAHIWSSNYMGKQN